MRFIKEVNTLDFIQYETAYPEDLLHYGVKGMKWKVHKKKTITGQPKKNKQITGIHPGAKTAKDAKRLKEARDYLNSIGGHYKLTSKDNKAFNAFGKTKGYAVADELLKKAQYYIGRDSGTKYRTLKKKKK